MKGNSGADEMWEIDYEDVIIDINEYILAVVQTYHDEENDDWGEQKYLPKNGTTEWTPKFYSSLSLPEWKCWTFEIEASEKKIIST